MFWKLEGKRFAESVLTEYLKSRQCIAYVSMVHVNDIVSLNAYEKEEQILINNIDRA